jgi:hypothetical protein
MPSSLGSTTSTRFHYGPEADKLVVEFEVAAAQTVNKGDLVKLATNGKVQLVASVEPMYNVIGVALHDGIAGEFVSVVMRAHTVVQAEAAAAATNAGPVQLGAYNAATLNREYAVLAGADDNIKTAKMVGHSITPGPAADGDIIQVALL